MTRILVIIVLILNTFYAGATTVCTRNDKVVIGLSNVTVPIELLADDDSSEWAVYYDGIGVVRGVYSRSNIYPSNINTYADIYTRDGGLATGNYQGCRNGSYNWCKITHPFESEWFFVPGTMGSTVSSCVNLMLTAQSAGTVRRGNVFKSVAIAD